MGAGVLLDVLKYCLGFIPAIIRRHTYIPEVFVRVEINGPHYPNRTDINSIVFSLTSRSGITKVKEGRVRFYDLDNPTDQQEQNTGEFKLFEGKEKEFRLPFTPIGFSQRVMVGEACLKAECNLALERPNGKPHEQDKRYTYDSKKRIFCEDHL